MAPEESLPGIVRCDPARTRDFSCCDRKVADRQSIAESGAGGFDGQGFAEAFLALDEEIHLRAQGGAALGFVEIGKEGIVLAIVDAAGVQPFGEDAGEGGFANAQRAFNDDEAGRLGTALGNASAFGAGRVVTGHR